MDNSELIFSVLEYRNRHNRLVNELNQVDLGIIFNRSDLFYYSNSGIDGIITVDDNITRYARRNSELTKEESILDVRPMKSFRLFKELAKNKKVTSLGLELDILPYKTVKYIQKALGNPELVDISDKLRAIRSVKSDREIEILKQAVQQTDESFEYIRDKIEPGLTELELSTQIEAFLRRQGHPGWVQVRTFQHNLTTTSYVMAGESTATLNSFFGPVSGQGLCKMHKNGPSRRKIKEGEAVLIDTTGVVEGYVADETRTFFVGQVPDLLAQAYENAKMVQNKTAKIMIPEVHVATVFEELNEVSREFGMYDNFMGIGENKVPFIGHGVGLELDEYPIITDKFDYTLQEGNVIAMEPKYIFDNPKTGVGIEDTWVVRSNHAERLTKTPW